MAQAVPPIYAVTDYQAAMQALLPRGRAWPRDPGSLLSMLFLGLAPTYYRQGVACAGLLADAFPLTPVDLLGEWEATLGLPDPCAGVQPTIQARQAQVAARFIAQGGQSVPYFIAFAANLGYAITITEFAPFCCGVNTCGQPLNGEAWAFAWEVNDPTFTISAFQCGRDACGEPLRWWGNTVLQCEMKRISPAHTTLFFSN
jgi:uncharacterized protein YmfQ (DUF2313 family)